MKRLIEIRSQEMICRERALSDPARREFWLGKAEDWEKCAVDEIASHFRECKQRKGFRLKLAFLPPPRGLHWAYFRFWQILLQKSKIERPGKPRQS
jgi:hypothetical protein